MKKLKYLLLLPFLLLTSCGNQNYAGRYAFSMGGTAGKRLKVEAFLSNEIYVPSNANEPEKKKFTFTVEIPFEEETTKVTRTESGNSLDQLSEGVIKGYYFLGQTKAEGVQVHVGVQEIDDIFKQELHIDISSDKIVQYIICGYVNESTLNIHIPVSMDDLCYQLVYYGFYANLESSTPFVDLWDDDRTNFGYWPGIGTLSPRGSEERKAQREKLIGNKPSAEDIEWIKNYVVEPYKGDTLDKIFPSTFTYRTFYTVKLGLNKY